MIDNDEIGLCEEPNKFIITDIDELYGIVIVVLFTFSMGLIILILEIVTHKYILKNQKEKFELKSLFSYFGTERHRLFNNVVRARK